MKMTGCWDRNVMFRLVAGAASLALCAFLGCGNMGAGGCDFTPGPDGNVNDNVDNDNGGTAGDNDNVPDGNGNSPANGNDNTSVDNTNDNTGGGTGGNDNGATAGNDNTPPANDNTGTGGNDNTVGNANDNGASNSNDNAADNSNDNTPGGGGGGGGGTPTNIRTKTSGATVPAALVVLSLDEDLPNPCEAAALWTQTSGPAVDGLIHQGDGSARFTAPTRDRVPTTMNLGFEVNIPSSCSVGARRGTAIVPVQVANLVFDLPATVSLNTPLGLDDFTAINGAPTDFLVIYLPPDPLPADVALDINQFASTLTVTSGIGSAVRITAQVFAAAGLLAEASDMIQIVAAD